MIAFGMNHSYPAAYGGPISPKALKGADRLVYHVARLLGLEAELRVVMVNGSDFCQDEPDASDGSNYSDNSDNSEGEKKEKRKPGWVLSDRCDFDLEYVDDNDRINFERETDLIWISKTGVEFQGGSYASYGNEVSKLKWPRLTLGILGLCLREWCHCHPHPRYQEEQAE